MTVTNISRAGLVSRQVELDAVNLHTANVTSRVNPLDTPAELDVRQEYRARYERISRHPHHLFVYVELRFTVRDVEGESSEGCALELTATYQLVYSLKEEPSEFPEDALRFFAELNGAYNVWPYWRELVQSVSGRVGLSAIVVPVFRPLVKAVEPEPAPSQPAPRKRVRKVTPKRSTNAP